MADTERLQIEYDNPSRWTPYERIRYYHNEVKGNETNMQLVEEVLGGIPNAFRIEHGYYEIAQKHQSVTDNDFRKELSSEYNATINAFGTAEERWATTVAIYRSAEAIIKEAGLEDFTGDCNAKSAFAIYDKKRRKQLDDDEVHDPYRMRFVANTIDDAYYIVGLLLINFPHMESHTFRHRDGDVHHPIRGDLVEPNERGYASLRMNLYYDTDTIIEVHILTKDALQSWMDFILKQYYKTHEPGDGGKFVDFYFALEEFDKHK